MDRFFKKVNQKANFGWHPPACPMPANPDSAILKDRFLKNLSKKQETSCEQQSSMPACTHTTYM